MLRTLNHFTIKIILLISCWAGALSAQDAQEKPSKALEGLIDNIVQPYLDSENTQSLAVGIIDGIHDYHYYYSASNNSNPLPNDSTIFPIGSASKIFTAYIMMKLVEEKQLSLSEPLTSFLPENLDNPTLQKLTPHLLASHQSGMPDKPQNYHLANKDPKNPFAHYTDSLSYAYLNAYKDSKKNYPIGKFRFSNYNFVVLGQILESHSDTTYSSLFQEYIVRSLSLPNIHPDLPIDLNNVNTLYSIVGKEVAPWQHNRYASSTGVYTSLPSGLSFLRNWIELRNNSDWNPVEECLMPQSSTDKKHVDAGYAWFVFPRNKKSPPLYTIGGKTGGSWCYFGMVPETGTAVVILSNSKHSVDTIGIEILDLLNR